MSHMRRESVPQPGVPPRPQAQWLQGTLTVENVGDSLLQALVTRSMVWAGTGGDTEEMRRGLWAVPALWDSKLPALHLIHRLPQDPFPWLFTPADTSRK